MSPFRPPVKRRHNSLDAWLAHRGISLRGPRQVIFGATFFEAFLELGSDISALYEYCEKLFMNSLLEQLLLSAYLLRMTALKQLTTASGVLLTHPRTAELLAAAVPEGPEATPPRLLTLFRGRSFVRLLLHVSIPLPMTDSH